MVTRDQAREAMREGRHAVARVRGVVRGGDVYEGAFWYIGPINLGWQRVPIEAVTEVRYDDGGEG